MRVALVVVSIASELLDMVLVVSDARVRDGQEALSSSVTGASMMVLACSVLLLVVLPASFFLVNYPPSFFTRKGRGRRDWLRKLWLLKKKKGELDESEAEELVQKAKLRDAYDVSLALGTCIFHPVRSLASAAPPRSLSYTAGSAAAVHPRVSTQSTLPSSGKALARCASVVQAQSTQEYLDGPASARPTRCCRLSARAWSLRSTTATPQSRARHRCAASLLPHAYAPADSVRVQRLH